MRRALLVAVIGAFLLLPGAAPSAQAQDGPLKHLTTDFVTGDVVVGGTSLYRAGVNGLATKNIVISGVPPEAEILSAYLYIQTTFRESLGEDAGMAGATFKGHSLNMPGGPIAKALNWTAGTQACWSYGWNPRRRLVTYRADVVRFLEIDPVTGKHVANGLHRVQVADAGRGTIRYDDDEDSPTMTGPRAVGASLVLVYRHPDPSTPLRAIVIYDGGVTKRVAETMTQRIQGFYQPAVNPGAKMIHIVGDGQPFFSERVQFGAQSFPNNPFVGANGLRWDNTTFNLAPTTLKTYPELNTLTVARHGLIPDCLSWSAIIVSTKVQDTDNDGLLNIWESPPTSIIPILDPDGHELPNLQAMGADPNVKDIFVEIGSMFTGQTVTYGSGDSAKIKDPHSHLPTQKALDMVGDAFKNAPVPINVHFDVGDNYQTDPPDPYMIPAAFARGGKAISETRACPNPDPDSSQPIECGANPLPGQYPLHPGTVGWKTGFRFYRDEILEFDPNRKGMFRFAFFAHALGLPKSEFPCLDSSVPPVPVPYDINGSCATPLEDNPDFHTPRTTSGVADWAGGDLLVTLGAFDDNDGKPVGTDFMQASTLMHEWGHNFGRRHGGDLFELNCKPQYLSVMNYLYQLRGLIDDVGVPQLNYAGGFVGVVNEASPPPSLDTPYRMGWYAPKATSYLKDLKGGAATKHCDGSELSDAEKLLPDGGMVRIDGTSRTGLIDWNANGVDDTAPQDLNFDGIVTPYPSSDDWANLRMNQLGSRRSVGGLFLDNLGRPTVGPLSLNAGKGDLGKGDLGKGDLGKGDLGKGDLGKGDLGKGDLGKGDLGGSVVSLTLGKGDLGKGDLGRGDLDVGSGTPAEQEVQELDFETAVAVTGGNPTPPSALQACLTSESGCSTDGGDRPVRLAWQAPNVGEVLSYLIYRFEYASEPFEAPAVLPTVEIDVVGPGEGDEVTYFDYDAPAGVNLAYFVIAEYAVAEGAARSFSGISNFATVTTPLPPSSPVTLLDNRVIIDHAPFYSVGEEDTLGALNYALNFPAGTSPGFIDIPYAIFDLGSTSSVSRATLNWNFNSLYLDSGPAAITLYVGNDASGTITINDRFMGTAVDTFTYSGGELRSFDVTALLNTMLSSGGQYFAIRLEATAPPSTLTGYYGGQFLTPSLTINAAVPPPVP